RARRHPDPGCGGRGGGRHARLIGVEPGADHRLGAQRRRHRGRRPTGDRGSAGRGPVRGGIRPQHDPADLRLRPNAGEAVVLRRRGGGQQAGPRRERPPWVQAAEAAGASVRWVDFDPETTELAPSQVGAVLSEQTRMVALTGASNLVGTRPDLPAIADLVHQAGALFYVDGVHLTPHAPVDTGAFGADFYACSPYKFLGPHCGVVAARPELLQTLWPDKLLPSTDEVPARFELGTRPYALLAGVTAAVDFLAGLDPDARGPRRERLVASSGSLESYEDALRVRLEDELCAIPGVMMHSRAKHRTPTLLFSIDGRESADLPRFLAQRQVNAPAGHFYAIEASRRIGLGDAGAVRIGIAPYTDDSEVDRLLDG